MGRLRSQLDQLTPHFAKGGRYQRYGALFEMVDTALYSPDDVTRRAPHVRDAIDLKRVMFFVVVAAIPSVLVGLWNTGFQANQAMVEMGLSSVPGWRGAILGGIGVGFDPNDVVACSVHGSLYFLPIYLTTLIVGGAWEVGFAIVRNHEINEGFLVTSLLFALILPADIPLWQVAMGISFGVVIGKEVFGGTGKNLLNPALVGRAFVYFAYPAEMSGDDVWVTIDGFSGATPLAIAAAAGIDGVIASGVTWMRALLGSIAGSLGETSALASLIGGAILVYGGVASWRIIVAVFVGMVLAVLAFNYVGSASNPMFAMPWYWHLVTGGFAFGMVFMATDPVTASQTDAGRWIYGALIGTLTVLIRVANPAYPEGIMMAILFANVFAPSIDLGVMWVHVRRRRRRDA